MNYKKLTFATQCILPVTAFLLSAISSFLLMLSANVSGLIVLAGPIGMGICGALMVAALATPFNNWFLTKELKGGGTGERLAAWITDEPKQEAYVGPNGIWLNGKKYYWGHSVFLSLQDINLKKTSRGVSLVIKLGEDLDRSTRYFDLEIPVPSGSEFDGETVAQGILAANIILDDAHNRKEMVTYLAQNLSVSPPDRKAAKT